jgi:dihydroflavonol-4-reductase
MSSGMKRGLVLVTGATGYLGRHAVFRLQDAGWKVRALCRSDEPSLSSQGIQVVRGDVLEPDTIAAALDGVDAVVHGAGVVSRDPQDAALMMRLHATGTRHVVGQAAARGVRRVVHLSTSGTVALGDAADVVFHEDDPVPFALLARFPYYLSKHFAERAADDAVRGTKTELVTLNPSLALGPGDVRGSSTTDVRRFLAREIPIVPSGGFSFVDVRDVADVVVRALDVGRPGQRYLLGALNCTFAEFFRRLETVSGVKGPSIPVSGRFAKAGVAFLERVAGAVGAKLPVTSMEAEMASKFWYVDARKAEGELAFTARDPMQTLLDTVKDIRGQHVEEKRVAAPRELRA